MFAKSLIVIPARLASTRLPRKLLLRETGKSVLQHTYEAACLARLPHEVIIAVDDQELLTEARAFGGRAEMTRSDHVSGTDRVAEIARRKPEYDILVNVQGDEPELPPQAIDQVVQLLQVHPQAVMATLATPLRDRERLLDPACVKVVMSSRGQALYFSRAPIPFARTWDDGLLTSEPPVYHQHLGLYAYRRDFLLKLATLPPTRYEQVEKLEQLRVLESGESIYVSVIPAATRGIDTPEDYQAFVARQRVASGRSSVPGPPKPAFNSLRDAWLRHP